MAPSSPCGDFGEHQRLLGRAAGIVDPADEQNGRLVFGQAPAAAIFRAGRLAAARIGRVQIDAVINRHGPSRRNPTPIDGQPPFFVADEHHPVAISGSPPFESAVDQPLPARAMLVKREALNLMNDGGDAGASGRQPPQDSRLGRLGMNQLKTLAAEIPVEVAIGPRVLPGIDRPNERRHGMPGDLHSIQFGGHRPGALAGDMNIEPPPVEMAEGLQHRPLHSAEDRQHLHVTNGNHQLLFLKWIFSLAYAARSISCGRSLEGMSTSVSGSPLASAVQSRR